MSKAYLLIGGNIGDRVAYLQKAKQLIEQEVGSITNYSKLYETAAWGIEDQEAFLNQVLVVETDLEADDLLNALLKIEESLGRKRTIKFGARTIDLDILLFNNEVINNTNLKIPHPALPDRRFALVPLNEIAPDLLHPQLNKTISNLLEDCKDTLPVTEYHLQ